MAADLAHDRDAGQRGRQLVAQPRPPLADALDQPLAAQDVHDLEPDRAGEWGAVPCVAQGEAPGSARERLVYVVGADHGADGGVTCAEPFGGRDDVRGQWKLFGSEPFAGPAHTGHDLVVADEKSVLLAALGKPSPELFRR